MTDLDKLGELAKAATPGPWGFENTGSTDPRDENHPFAVFSETRARNGHCQEVIGYDEMRGGKQDATFIAAANPAAVLALIADHRAALARIAKVEALHQPYTKNTVRHGSYVLCDACGGEWPCDTSRALTEGENDGG